MTDSEISKVVEGIFLTCDQQLLKHRLKLKKSHLFRDLHRMDTWEELPQEIKNLTFHAGDGKTVTKTVETFTWEKLDFVNKIKKEFKI